MKDNIFDNNVADEDKIDNDVMISDGDVISNKFNFVNDYIFICYFLGNDFLPHLPSIDINTDGLDTLINCYLDVFQDLGRLLIKYEKNKILIDNEFLQLFITRIATKEEEFFKHILPDNLRKQSHKRCFESEPHKREIWIIENLKNIRIVDVLKLGYGTEDDWKYRYYSHYFHTSEHMKEMTNNICHNYIEGLLWVSKYYFEKCPTWRWQYKYTHAPFLSDIMLYLKHKDIKDFELDKSSVLGPVDMYTQLVSVIPPSYSYILPKTLRHLNHSIESPIIDMFPLSYQIDMINKTQLYKCVPIIPYLDVGRIEKAIKGIKLSDDDKIRCDIGKPFDLGICKIVK